MIKFWKTITRSFRVNRVWPASAVWWLTNYMFNATPPSFQNCCNDDTRPWYFTVMDWQTFLFQGTIFPNAYVSVGIYHLDLANLALIIRYGYTSREFSQDQDMSVNFLRENCLEENCFAMVFATETKLLVWRNFRHGLYWKLSKWQLSGQAVAKISLR